MVNCPLCDAAIDVDADELDEGDSISCDECGKSLSVVSLEPLELASDDEDDFEDEDEDFEDEEELDGEDDDSGEDWGEDEDEEGLDEDADDSDELDEDEDDGEDEDEPVAPRKKVRPQPGRLVRKPGRR